MPSSPVGGTAWVRIRKTLPSRGASGVSGPIAAEKGFRHGKADELGVGQQRRPSHPPAPSDLVVDLHVARSTGALSSSSRTSPDIGHIRSNRAAHGRLQRCCTGVRLRIRQLGNHPGVDRHGLSRSWSSLLPLGAHGAGDGLRGCGEGSRLTEVMGINRRSIYARRQQGRPGSRRPGNHRLVGLPMDWSARMPSRSSRALMAVAVRLWVMWPLIS
jgi:hypothetical protein